VVEAADGPEALSALKRQVFNLVLLDLRLPGMDGIEVLRRIIALRPEVPVVMITAYGTVETAVEAIQAGARNFVEKPFELDTIRALVVQMITVRKEDESRVRDAYDRIVERARLALSERRLEGAMEHARTALQVQASRPEAFNIMGIVMQLRRDVGEAQRFYRSALALDDTYEPARKNLENISGFPKMLGRFEA
jgi:DNA-binding NtrC family response regulator